jgi:DNA-binding transcriptional LysR family regulator
MASQLHTTPRGVLRVSAPLSFGAARIAPALADFSKQYPEVTVELILTDRTVDLIEEGFDLAIHIGDPPDSSSMTRLLTVFQTIVCGAPEYIRERGIPLIPADLAGHNCLTYVSHAFSKQWDFVGPDHQSHSVRVSGNLRTNSPSAQLAAALRGQGLTLQPRNLVADDIRCGRLRQVLAEYKGPEIPVRLIYLSGRHLSAKIRAMVDFLVEIFYGK